MISAFDEILRLTIRHPWADFRRWSALPGTAAERHMARETLRFRFVDGQLSLLRPAGRARGVEEGSGTSLVFYFFCDDPYFIRVTDLPVFLPGRHLPRFLPGTEDAADGETATPTEIVDFDEERQRDVAQSRKKYRGSAFGPPPVGMVEIDPATFPSRQRIVFELRRVYWRYEVFPVQPSLALEGGGTEFVPKADAERVVFTSSAPLPLAPRGLPGPSLVLTEGGGRGVRQPLLENLPAPAPEGLAWDPELNDYVGTVRLDLRRFGLTV